MFKDNKGFTLTRLLIVIGIIFILAIIIAVVVNPARRFGLANDAKRKSDIDSIFSAIYQYQMSPVANTAFPQCLTGAARVAAAIPECNGAGMGDFDGALELGTPGSVTTYDCSTMLVPSFLPEMPIDPTATYSAAHSGYYICQDTSGAAPRVYVIAAGAEILKTDGNCQVPGTTNPAMCVSG